MRHSHLSLDLEYNRDVLVEIITKNREDHLAKYAEAMHGWRLAVIAKLEKKLGAAREGEKVNLKFNLAEPRCHVADYDSALKMLSLTSQDEIELTHDTFMQLVENQWDWSDMFHSSHMSYTQTGD